MKCRRFNRLLASHAPAGQRFPPEKLYDMYLETGRRDLFAALLCSPDSPAPTPDQLLLAWGPSDHGMIDLDILVGALERHIAGVDELITCTALDLLEAIGTALAKKKDDTISLPHVARGFAHLWNALRPEEKTACCIQWDTSQCSAFYGWALSIPRDDLEMLLADAPPLSPEQAYRLPAGRRLATAAFWSQVALYQEEGSLSAHQVEAILEGDGHWTSGALLGLLHLAPDWQAALPRLFPSDASQEQGTLLHWLLTRQPTHMPVVEVIEAVSHWTELAPSTSLLAQTSLQRSVLDLITSSPAQDRDHSPPLLKWLLACCEETPYLADTLLPGSWGHLLAHLGQHPATQECLIRWKNVLESTLTPCAWESLDEGQQQTCQTLLQRALVQHQPDALQLIALIPSSALEVCLDMALCATALQSPYAGAPQAILDRPWHSLGTRTKQLCLAYLGRPAASLTPSPPGRGWLGPQEAFQCLLRPSHRPLPAESLLQSLQTCPTCDALLEGLAILHRRNPATSDSLPSALCLAAALLGIESLAQHILEVAGPVVVDAQQILFFSDRTDFELHRFAALLALPEIGLSLHDGNSLVHTSAILSEKSAACVCLLLEHLNPNFEGGEMRAARRLLKVASGISQDADFLLRAARTALRHLCPASLSPLLCVEFLQALERLAPEDPAGFLLAQELWQLAPPVSPEVIGSTIDRLSWVEHPQGMRWLAELLQTPQVTRSVCHLPDHVTAAWCARGHCLGAAAFRSGLQRLCELDFPLSLGGIPRGRYGPSLPPPALGVLRADPALFTAWEKLYHPRSTPAALFIALLVATSEGSAEVLRSLALLIEGPCWATSIEDWEPHLGDFLRCWSGWEDCLQSELKATLAESMEGLSQRLPRPVLQYLWDESLAFSTALETLHSLGLFSSLFPLGASDLCALLGSTISDATLLEWTEEAAHRGLYALDKGSLLLSSAVMGRHAPAWVELIAGQPGEVRVSESLQKTYTMLAKLKAIPLTRQLWRGYLELELSAWREIWNDSIAGELWWPQWWESLAHEAQSEVVVRLLAVCLSTPGLEASGSGQPDYLVALRRLGPSFEELWLRAALERTEHSVGQGHVLELLDAWSALSEPVYSKHTPWLSRAFQGVSAPAQGNKLPLDAAMQLLTEGCAPLYSAGFSEEDRRGVLGQLAALEHLLTASRERLEEETWPIQESLFEAWRKEMHASVGLLAGRLQEMQAQGEDWKPLFANLLTSIVCPAGTLTDLQDILEELMAPGATLVELIGQALRQVRRKILQGSMPGGRLNNLQSPHEAQMLHHLLGSIFLGDEIRHLPDGMESALLTVGHAAWEIPRKPESLPLFTRSLLEEVMQSYRLERCLPDLARSLTETPGFEVLWAECGKLQPAAPTLAQVLLPAQLDHSLASEPGGNWSLLQSFLQKVLRLPLSLRSKMEWQTALVGACALQSEAIALTRLLPERPRQWTTATVEALSLRHRLDASERHQLRSTLGQLWRHDAPTYGEEERASTLVLWESLSCIYDMPLPASWETELDYQEMARMAQEWEGVCWAPTSDGLREVLLLEVLRGLANTPGQQQEGWREELTQKIEQRILYLQGLVEGRALMQAVQTQNWVACADYITPKLIHLGFLQTGTKADDSPSPLPLLSSFSDSDLD